MKIQRQLRIIVTVVLLTSLFFSVSIFLDLARYRTAYNNTLFANTIVLRVFERRLLSDEYERNHTDRAKAQWFAKQQELQKLLDDKEAQPGNSSELQSINDVRTVLAESEDVFGKMITLIESEPVGSQSAAFLEKQDSLSTQLSIKAQETITVASRLASVNIARVSKTLDGIVLLFSLSSSLFFLLLLYSFWVIWKGAKKLDQDINARKNAEEVLSEDKARDDAIIQSIGDGLIATDERGRIIIHNQTALDLLGFSHDELINQWLPKVLLAVDEKGEPIDNDMRPITEALTTGEKVSQICYYIKKNGEKFPVAITVSPIMLKDKPVGAIEVFRDITKERNIDRMKTEFISLASHQLRTPLSAMKWFSEMLLAGDAGKLSDEQQEMVKNISDSNERMIELVNSLLNVSRIESGRIMIDPEPTNLGELARSVILELTVKLKEKKQNPIVSVHGDLPLISIDPKLIRQVYVNLLTNAIKYTPEGGDISVFISKKDDVIISQVSDSGYGIPQKDAAKVFQKFYRGDNIVSRVTDGNGLGLYLVKAIIESSKGKIWFESAEGKGTSFWFSLPLTGTPAKKGEVTLSS